MQVGAEPSSHAGESKVFVLRIRSPPVGSVLLGLQNVALVDPPASKEAVAYHLVAEQKNEGYQDDQQEKLYDPYPG
jgi:hypothetical protein